MTPEKTPELWEQVRDLQGRIKELEERLTPPPIPLTPVSPLTPSAEPPEPVATALPAEPTTAPEVRIPPPVVRPTAPAPRGAWSFSVDETEWQKANEASTDVRYGVPDRLELKVVDADADEMQWGRKVLPWVGAAMISVGLVLLTTYLIRNGAITPTMQFGLSLLLCAGFGGVGEWLRAKGHPLAQVLAGLASFGGFVTVIGGYSTFKIYSGETSFHLVLGLSLANIGYSAFRRWEVFTGGGLAGGMVAAFMVNDKPGLALATALIAGVIAGLTSAYFEWRRMVWLAYLETVAVVTLRNWFPDLNSLESVLAYQMRFVIPSAMMLAYVLRTEKEAERILVGVPAIWVIGAVYATYPVTPIYGLNPFVMWSIWGVPMGVLAWYYRKDAVVCPTLGATAYLAVTVLQPLTLPGYTQPLIWLGLAVIGLAVTIRYRTILALATTTSWQVFSIGAWLYFHPRWAEYSVFWLSHFALHAVMVYLMREDEQIKRMDGASKLSGLALGVLPLAFVTSYSGLRFIPVSQTAAVTLSLLIVAAGFSLVGLGVRSVTLRYIGWMAWVALVLKIFMVDFVTMSDEWRIVTLLASGITALTVAGVYLRNLKAKPGKEAEGLADEPTLE